MFTEEEFIVSVYCVIVQYVQQIFPTRLRHAGVDPNLSDEEALTIEMVGEYLGIESARQVYRDVRSHYHEWFPALPDRSTLVCQWQNLWRVKDEIWQAIVRERGVWRDPIQRNDTFPVPIGHVRRAGRRGIFLDDGLYQPSYGYCAAKDGHYFGFNGGLRRSSGGMILAAPILPASPHDIDLLDTRLLGTPADTHVFGDPGFLDRAQQLGLRDAWGRLVKPPLRRNLSGRAGFRLHPLENRLRRLLETVIGQLTERFHLQTLRVRKGWTLAAKWYRKILMHTMCVWTNLKYGYPLTQLKALVHD